MEATLLQIATFAIAVIGAVLGVLNTWRTWSADRVRLRVRTMMAYLPQGGEALGVEVTNLSNFAVTVNEIGWTRPGATRLALVAPIVPSGERLPVRLEPRTGFTGYTAPGAHQQRPFATIDAAYVTTACGITQRHTSALVVDVAKRALAGSQ